MKVPVASHLGVGVKVGVASGVGVRVAVGVAVGIGVCVAVGVAVGVEVGVGAKAKFCMPQHPDEVESKNPDKITRIVCHTVNLNISSPFPGLSVTQQHVAQPHLRGQRWLRRRIG